MGQVCLFQVQILEQFKPNLSDAISITMSSLHTDVNISQSPPFPVGTDVEQETETGYNGPSVLVPGTNTGAVQTQT